jgi:hypothetical protein
LSDNDDIITDLEICVDTLHFDSNTAIDDLGDLDG